MTKLTSIKTVDSELVVVCNVCNPDALPMLPMWSMDQSGGYLANRHIEYNHSDMLSRR